MIRILCLLLLATSAYAQPTFQSIASFHYVSSVAVANDTVWAGTYGGVMAFHRNGTLLKIHTNVDGLIHNQVSAILIDSKGDKWFGTDYGGISRLHGNTWTSYRELVSGSALGINAIAEDKSGNIWFASNGVGTSKFNGTFFTSYNTQTSGIAGNQAYSLAVDATGKVWVGLLNAVSSFDGTNWVSYSLPGATSVESISIDSNGDKWFSSFSGMSRLSGTTMTPYPNAHFQIAANDYIKTSYVDQQDNLWMGVADKFSRVGKGIIKYAIATQQVTPRYTEPVGEIQQILKVGSDLYMASGTLFENGKLYRYDGSTWITYSSGNSLGGFITNAMLEDASGNMWFATGRAGITKFDGVTYTVYNSTNSGLPNSEVFSLARTPNGDIYAGTAGAVMVFHNGVWSQSYSTSGRVNRMDVDSQGNVWIVSDGSGAARYNGTSWVNYKVSNSAIVSDKLWSLQIDSHDNVWIGSYDNKGVSLYSNGIFTSFNSVNSGLGNGIVTEILVDKDDVVWAGIYEKGVYKYNQGQWSLAYSTANTPLPNNSISSMCVDASGRYWFTSAYGEVGYAAVFNGVAWKIFTMENSGLISSGVWSVSPDHLGNVWIGAFWGVSKISGDPYIKVNQTITFSPIADRALGAAMFGLEASATSKAAVTFSTTSDKISIASDRVTVVKAGRAIVKANQPGSDIYNAAPTVERSFCIKPAKPTIALSEEAAGTTLTSSEATSYQWFKDGVALSGETNQKFAPKAVGVYKVQVKVDDCISDFSDDKPLLIVTDVTTGEHRKITAYPNPAEDYLEVRGFKTEIRNTQLLDMIGHTHSLTFEKVGEETWRAHVKHLSSGVYLLRLQEENTIRNIRIIKN